MITTGGGERLNVKWAAGVEEVELVEVRQMTSIIMIMIIITIIIRGARPAPWPGSLWRAQ